MSESNTAKTLAKNTMFLYIRMFLVLIGTLYMSRIVLKVLGFDDYGIYNLVGSVVVFFTFLRSALTNATYRYLAYSLGEGNADELKRIYSMAINCHIILALALFVLMELVGVWFLNYHLNIPSDRLHAANWVFQFSLLTFCISVVQTPFHSNIIAHEQMNYYAVISIVEMVMKLGIAFMLVYSPVDKLVTYGCLLFVVALLVFIAYVLYCRITFKDAIYIRCWDNSRAVRLVSYSGWSMLVNGADLCSQQCISIYFNWFVGVVGNAALGISNQVNSGINMFVSNFSQAFNPQIIKSYAAKNYSKFMSLIYTSSKISYILFVILAIPITVNAEYILTLWLGDYPDITPALVRVTMLFYLFDSFQVPLWQAVHATGNLKFHQIMIGAIKALAIPLTYLVFYLGGSPVQVLGCWAALNGVCALGRTLYMRKLINLDLREYFSHVVIRLGIMTILSLPLPIIITQKMGISLVATGVSTVAAVACVCVFSYYTVFSKDERSVLKSLPLVGKLFRISSR